MCHISSQFISEYFLISEVLILQCHDLIGSSFTTTLRVRVWGVCVISVQIYMYITFLKMSLITLYK